MPLPRLPPARSSLVELVPTSQTSALLARRSETALLAMLVHRVDNPVDARIAADGLVLRVDEDDLVVLVCAVLVDPVGVQDAQVGAAATDAGFGGGFEGALVFELVHTLVCWLAYSFCQHSNYFAQKDDAWCDIVPYVAPLGTGLFLPPRRTRTR